MEIALNELSLEQSPTLEKLKERIDAFIKLIIEVAYYSGRERTIALRTLSDFSNTLLFPEINFYNLPNKIKIDKDEYSFLLGLLTQKPYLDFELNEEEISLVESCEVKFQGKFSKGLLFAYKYKGLAVSWFSSNVWHNSSIEVNVFELINGGNANEYTAKVKHASRKENLSSHLSWLNSFRFSHDGMSLITHKSTLFPQLKFLGETEIQIQSLNTGDKRLKSLIPSLFMLQDYCRGLDIAQNIEFSTLRNFGFSFRADSEATLNKYGAERKYIDPNNVEKTASWHFDINPGNWRGYIAWDSLGKEIWLTYVGPHLKTKEFD